ncbi:pyruvate dehydrogenase complex dihydrolipoamide acetyltransferase [Marivirga harenae]|uniref:pyruvate dehydrogenase complex dihydrolipoamide acetyltransferase n=1 Tax=Marivirga harenae TaxID=2010992 RepID=UPI0026E0C787|nr:pyruvate dehydrogenase complex dihydrolipoamide acetyltransferase [Marivirga harenae]WKV11718.1 pyruvate dehydrogenase complex dihydrolipoamide acetyltransferase [Marivirga harenae]|tara:strand:- start:219076 stop:220770 length:1695 start_codon:yes stop_codon:yes gene_type:complete
MAEVIKMPKMSDTMEEGVISSWLVKEGDEVSSGDVLAEVETDKATMELESYEDGVILHIGVKEGDAVPIEGVIAIIGEKGEDIDGLLKEIENGGEAASSNKSDNDKADKKESKETSSGGKEESIDASDVNATLITMPKMSDTMEEGVIASWLKKEGDKVEAGDILAEVETDKATMELEAYEDGTLLYIGIKEGDAAPIDGVIAVIGEEGADYEKLIKAHEQKSSGTDENKKEEKTEEKDKSTSDSKPGSDSAKPTPPAETSNKEGRKSDGGRIFASPLAKKIAKDKGIDLADVEGSGGNGRIIKSDVENFTPKAKSSEAPQKDASTGQAINIPQVVGEESYEEVKVSQMRKTVAKRLSESKFTAPHFYVTMEINMDKAMDARKSINELSPVKISFNDIVIKAVASALRQHPKVNSSWMGDKIRRNQHIHVGMAVAVEEGLLVPVIRFADNKSLSHIAAEAKDFAQKAKNKELEPKDWEGNTFTVSNLGMFGVEEFTAIINPPDACILAVGGIKQTAVVKDGQLVPGNIMKVTLSCDHRVVDGAVGSAFLQTLKGLLEDPVRILI